ncbi:MAG: dinitrogenase iron-molybdenum cofactor biosynthesis protein [Lachnospiraceae bacterium]|nr:dinitrogenase iron-molybdenum cofactor biosynthesis protein [Lachnospiraceae bacterium]
MDDERKYQIAVASSDGIVVNSHFGRADQFLIYQLEIDNENDDWMKKYVELRKVAPVCQGGNHDDNRLEKTADLFLDCKYILVSRIGQGAANVLEGKGIIPMELPGMIDESIHQLIIYEKLKSLF